MLTYCWSVDTVLYIQSSKDGVLGEARIPAVTQNLKLVKRDTLEFWTGWLGQFTESYSGEL